MGKGQEGPYIQRVAGNIKGTFEVELGPKTLIAGNNGAGKSRITDAVQVVLKGSVPDVGGKEAGQERMLMALANAGEERLWAELTLSDGTKATYETTGTTESAKRANRNAPTTVLPLDDLYEILVEKGGDTARRFFAQQACRHLLLTDVEKQFPGSVWAQFKDEADAVTSGKKTNAMDLLLAVRERAADGKKKAQADVRDADKVLSALAATMDVVLDSDVERAKADAQTALQVFQALQNEANAANNTRALADQRDRAVHAMNQITARVAEIDQWLQMNPPPDAAARRLREDSIRLLEALLVVLPAQAKAAHEGRLTACVVCHGAVAPDNAARIADQVQAQAQATIAAFRQKGAADEVHDRVMKERSDAVAAYQEHYANYNDAVQRLAVAADGNRDVRAELAMAQQAWQDAQRFASELEGKLRASDSQKRAREDKVTASDAVERFERLRKHCDEAIETLLAASVGGYEKRVNAYLPDGETFGLQLNPFKVGLRRGDVLHTALSGAEWSRVTMALASVLCADADGLVVVVPEERAYDPDHLAQTMRALTKSRAQVLITSPILPAGKTPAGWTVLQVGEVTAPKTTRKKKAATEEAAEPPPQAASVLDEDEEDTENPDALPIPDAAAGAPDWLVGRGRACWAGLERDLAGEIEKRWGGQSAFYRHKAPGKPGGPEQVFTRFGNGAVSRVVGSRAFLFEPPATSGPVTPVWASSPGPLLWSGSMAQLHDTYERLFGVRLGAVAMEPAHPAPNGRWVRYDTGAVSYTKDGGVVALYAGTSGKIPQIGDGGAQAPVVLA